MSYFSLFLAVEKQFKETATDAISVNTSTNYVPIGKVYESEKMVNVYYSVKMKKMLFARHYMKRCHFSHLVVIFKS